MIRKKEYECIRIKNPDTNVLFILLHYVDRHQNVTILFDTGTGDRKILINIGKVVHGYTVEYCTSLMSPHANTDCDITSTFKRMGKELQQMPKYVPVLARLDDSWQILTQLIDELDEFTCAMYGRSHSVRINNLCFQKMTLSL